MVDVCTDMFAGTYNTTIPSGDPWQAAPQETTSNVEIARQLRVSHTTNQGILYQKKSRGKVKCDIK